MNLDSLPTKDLLELVAVLRKKPLFPRPSTYEPSWLNHLFDGPLNPSRPPSPDEGQETPPVTKAAHTVTISSGGPRRDRSLNPIVSRVRRQLIALVSLHSNREKIAQVRAWVLKVSGASFADAARGILTAGYAAAYVAGHKDTKAPTPPVVAPPAAPPGVDPTSEAAQEARDERLQESIEDPLDDMDEEDAAFYGDSLDALDSDGQDAVTNASDGLDDRLLALGALLIGGAVSAAMLDAWMGTYANSLNPLYEEGFQAGVNTLGEVQQVTWRTHEEEGRGGEACDLCASRDGMTWVGDEIDAAMPHPGEGTFGELCVTPETLVVFESVEVAFRRWYEGPVVEIASLGGRHLTTTPNHPVLTDRGWVPAYLLQIGDHVIGCAFTEGVSVGCPDVEYVPARIDEVFSSASRHELSEGMMSNVEDFYGQGIGHGQVDVVVVHGQLRNHTETALLDPLPQSIFADAHGRERSRAMSDRRAYEVVGVPLDVGSEETPLSPSFYASGEVLKPLALRHTGSREAAALARTAKNALSTQCRLDGPSPKTEHFTDPPGRVTSKVALAEFLHGARAKVEGTVSELPCVATSPDCDTGAGQPASQGRATDLQFLREMEQRGSCDIALDEVIGIEIGSYRGHVYNLQTSNGAYVANGIVTHNCEGSYNCRCSLDYEVVPADQATYSMGGYDDTDDGGDVSAMSTADLLKVWSILARAES